MTSRHCWEHRYCYKCTLLSLYQTKWLQKVRQDPLSVSESLMHLTSACAEKAISITFWFFYSLDPGVCLLVCKLTYGLNAIWQELAQEGWRGGETKTNPRLYLLTDATGTSKFHQGDKNGHESKWITGGHHMAVVQRSRFNSLRMKRQHTLWANPENHKWSPLNTHQRQKVIMWVTSSMYFRIIPSLILSKVAFFACEDLGERWTTHSLPVQVFFFFVSGDYLYARISPQRLSLLRWLGPKIP